MDQLNPTTPATEPAATGTAPAPVAAVETPTNPAAPQPATTETAATAPAAPEAYTDFDVPETVIVDTELMGEFKSAAKDIGLSQEQAQHLASMGAKMAQKITEQAATAQAERIAAWEAETKADKDIGGAQLEANLATAKKALDAFGSPELNELLVETGIGNHPAIIKAFVKAGQAMSEDTLMPSSAQVPSAQTSIAQKLYPNMNP
jgi:hypothetical protein